ncbi:MAG: hypothetical protein QF440_03450 [Candidatus Thalassarchaeaceae archaeon]|jgi:hypothetical protein|nr:hypothetical protein [Candidatus Thalassarchaeaceae archaeon]|tara:strand:- start:92 stop:394 length:303 start_codon:yes stop_codon:yes gene_type:complete
MRTCIERLIALPHVNSITLREEILFIESTLESLRIEGVISNDAYLDAGAIQGGLSMLANLIDHGITRQESQEHLRGILARGDKLSIVYPDLDSTVEKRRK